SRVPFETWVLPRCHAAKFQDATDAEIDELAAVMRRTLLSLEACLGRVAYNYLLHTLPFNSSDKSLYHWHFEILPRTSRLAGLEWGSGLLVNTVDPNEAGSRLRRATLPTS
ncbi:MAG: hypothetical protein KDB23_12795, partial [Planctomycetales bacterium]|nr:hypothetical protein [Planctomycetales bacterium]